jgi:hypothetical protein
MREVIKSKGSRDVARCGATQGSGAADRTLVVLGRCPVCCERRWRRADERVRGAAKHGVTPGRTVRVRPPVWMEPAERHGKRAGKESIHRRMGESQGPAGRRGGRGRSPAEDPLALDPAALAPTSTLTYGRARKPGP